MSKGQVGNRGGGGGGGVTDWSTGGQSDKF